MKTQMKCCRCPIRISLFNDMSKIFDGLRFLDQIANLPFLMDMFANCVDHDEKACQGLKLTIVCHSVFSFLVGPNKKKYLCLG